jgi:hypothetical protein
MDGGAAWNTNLISAIDRCLEVVDDDSKIVLDVIICDDAHIKTSSVDTTNAISNFLRYYSIKHAYGSLNDILEFKRARPKVNYRYIVIPSETLASGLNEMKFDNATLFPMVEIGKKDAQNVISMGEGAVIKRLIEWD